MGAMMNMKLPVRPRKVQPQTPVPPGQYDPMRGVPAGAQSMTGKTPVPPAATPPAPVQTPALTMRPVNAQPSATPLPARPVITQPAPVAPIRPIQTIKLTPNAKAPAAWNLSKPGVMTATAQTGALPAVGNGKNGKNGKGGKKGAGNAITGGATVPISDPNAKLPVGAGSGGVSGGVSSGGAGGGVSGGTNSQGGGVSGGVSGGPAAPAPYDVNAGRMNLLENILSNPESMTPEVINSMIGEVRDTRDARAQDMERRLKEQFAGRGLGESGVLDQLLMNENLAASQDIANAERGIRTDAARTNFNDRINAVNTALGQVLGVGDLRLKFEQLNNQQFNADRGFQMQLADALTQTGLIGQQQQSSLLGQMNALISSGMAWQDALKQAIMQAASQRYADPNVGAVQQTGYAPNPYLDMIAAQQNSGGGGSDTDWFNAALQGGSALAGLFV
ncbi:MAG: hypothetical protein IT366_24625 [Candidatus Hydrogenedentes bacterium]|nr:hypothetical protein [Candidatus Hydrogenedentota bacterium]